MKRAVNKAHRIGAAWEQCEVIFGDDKSTEFMIAWTADAARASYEEVVDWLSDRAPDAGEPT
jgi:hypothetical protein